MTCLPSPARSASRPACVFGDRLPRSRGYSTVAAEAAAFDEPESSPPPSPERIAGLVRQHYSFVWRLLRRLGLREGDADDAAQQVFLAAAGRLGGVEVTRERAFLYGVALNVGARARRSLGRRREEPLEAAGEREGHEPNAEQLLERHQARALLDQLLDEMPEDLRDRVRAVRARRAFDAANRRGCARSRSGQRRRGCGGHAKISKSGWHAPKRAGVFLEARHDRSGTNLQTVDGVGGRALARGRRRRARARGHGAKTLVAPRRIGRGVDDDQHCSSSCRR